MRQQRSKAQLLYELVATGNVDAIKALSREGASLEWIDRDGKNPLIVACMNPELFDVAKALIELGANVDAYRPGRHAGTPLHHAAKRGLERIVILLLSHGANALVRNDDCQTPLDVARLKGHTNVVRAIENHVCLFSGWVRQIYGPGFLEALAPQLMSRKNWVVVTPCGPNNPTKPLKLELAVYSTVQDSQPSNIVALWKVRIEEPNFRQSDPTLTIFDDSIKFRLKLASAIQGDKHQLQLLYNACRGIPQVMPPSNFHNIGTAQTDAELAMALSASMQSAPVDATQASNSHQMSEASDANGWGISKNEGSYNGWGPTAGTKRSEANNNGWMGEKVKEDYNGWEVHDSRPPANPTKHVQVVGESTPIVSVNDGIIVPALSKPSAPPLPEELLSEGSIRYPSIDFGQDDSTKLIENEPSTSNDTKHGGGSSSCIVCWEALVQGACIPCGHMAGCMPCLNEIKAKKGVCPVCRSKIDQVVRLYAV
ncbi:hypothetical protein UlMin_031664 [Ulmus minor]